MSKNLWVGCDLGGSKTLSVVYDDDQQEQGRERRKTRGHEGKQAGMERIAGIIASSIEDAKAETSDISAIGIGCPGPLDMDAGVLHEAPNLGWQDVKLKEFLEYEFKCPVFVMNDVDAGVYGEFRAGAAKDARCVLGIFPGTGIGGACVYNGEIVRGKNRTSMEIGHIPVMQGGPLCGCGQRGCLESVAGRLAVAAEVSKAAVRGEAPHVFAKTGTDIRDIRSGALAKAVKDGEKIVKKILVESARLIGVAAAGVVNLLTPEIIVLGGGLVEALPEIYVEEVASAANNRVMPAYKDTFKVVAAKLGDNAAVLGAALWAEKQLAAQKK